MSSVPSKVVAVNEPSPSLPILVSVSEIAQLTGGKPSSVSTWRARFPDEFPEPVVGGSKPLFDAQEVLGWVNLRRSMSQVAEPTPGWWWRKAASAYIGKVGPDTGRPSLVALVLFAHRLRASDDDGRSWAGLVVARDTGTDPGLEVRRLASELEEADPALNGLLVEPLAPIVADPCLGEVIGYLDRALVSADDVGSLVTAVLRADGSSAAVKVASTLTSSSQARLMVALARVAEGDVVLDPAAGEGEVLVQCARLLGDGVVLKGQEIATAPWRIARSRLVLMGVSADMGERPADSMVDNRFADVRADVVLLDPPLEMLASSEMEADQGAPPLDAWLQYGLRHLDDRGRLVVLVPGRYLRARLRKRRGFSDFSEFVDGLIARGQVEAIVVLPGRMRADVVDDQALLVMRGQGSDVSSGVAQGVLITSSSTTGTVNIDHLVNLIGRTGDRWIESAQERGMVDVSPVSTIEFLYTGSESERAVHSRPSKRLTAGRGAVAAPPPPAEDDEAPLRREIRVLEERLDDIRRRA
ncbi:MAG: hypothetical protein RI958_614, partial [Actinomycetota bacterium]